MSREWKPGDVALIRVGAEYPPEVAVHGGGIFAGKWYVGGPRYGSQHGWYHDRVEVVRPLVAIDPESVVFEGESDDDENRIPEIVNCLRRIAEADGGRTWRARLCLRLADEFDRQARPPKPAEPEGWLAAVEDPRTDQRWYRDGDADTHPWRQRRDDGIHARNTWDELPRTVRVLSEGVTP